MKQTDTLDVQPTKRLVAIGVGATNRCNLNCPHCYSRDSNKHDLSLHDYMSIYNMGVGVESVNFGTGESFLNPDFIKMAQYGWQHGTKLSLTSNGYTVSRLSDEELAWFNDVDVSVDFADQLHQDAFRGRGSWALAIAALERLQNQGREFSIASCLMDVNQNEVVPLLKLARQFGCNLRFNIYKPVHTTRYRLSYEDFWKCVHVMCENAEIVSCGEPIIKAALHLEADTPIPCGTRSFRIHPDGMVVPCVYCRSSSVTIQDLCSEKFLKELEWKNTVPAECEDCPELRYCAGGCKVRRLLNGGMEHPDEYCPIAKGKPMYTIRYTASESRDLVHSGYLCTTILR